MRPPRFQRFLTPTVQRTIRANRDPIAAVEPPGSFGAVGTGRKAADAASSLPVKLSTAFNQKDLSSPGSDYLRFLRF
jgi:hypothetical protein